MLLFRAFGKKKDTGGDGGGATSQPLKTPTAGTEPQPTEPVATTIDMEKTQRIKGQLDEVTGIMNENISTAQKRGADLDDLQKQVQDVEAGAGQFSKNSAKVKKNLWYKNMKMTVMLTVVVLVILAIIIGVIVWQNQSK